ncbi:MAG: bifunctional helix-turn-helix domain-containing protein/methylated-DNA--[protein]-cysteine S-methyltransferase [Bacteroidales bacterium]|nr:bifunctional helix-turn-helix domain-containing protein/methylated-DNA--[protein]-cysteine S-methyltransferase [Bacteroidales bacterium]
MKKQEATNYSRIAEAIEQIQQSTKESPSLEEIAAKMHLSPSHFQQLFTDWAGVSSEKFMQCISIQHAKQILIKSGLQLTETISKSELSATGRLRDLFVKTERMTPEEHKNNGEKLSINYSFSESLFGKVLIASTHKGICYLSFADNEQLAFSALEKRFPKAVFIQQTDDIQQNALQVFTADRSKINTIKLQLIGTDFQLKVWEALLKIPRGNLTTYGAIASLIQKPKAARAVGTAIGSNPVAFLIPCHRIIQSSGSIGGYMWGTTRKTALIGWEGAIV